MNLGPQQESQFDVNIHEIVGYELEGAGCRIEAVDLIDNAEPQILDGEEIPMGITNLENAAVKFVLTVVVTENWTVKHFKTFLDFLWYARDAINDKYYAPVSAVIEFPSEFEITSSPKEIKQLFVSLREVGITSLPLQFVTNNFKVYDTLSSLISDLYFRSIPIHRNEQAGKHAAGDLSNSRINLERLRADEAGSDGTLDEE